MAAASLSGCLCLVSWWEPPGFAAFPLQEAARCGPETASLCAAIAAVCTPCDSLQLSASAETNPGAVTNHNLGLGPVGAGGFTGRDYRESADANPEGSIAEVGTCAVSPPGHNFHLAAVRRVLAALGACPRLRSVTHRS